MLHLFQSSIMQALGYAIANSLWQTALVWLLYTIITGFITMSAAARYRLAVVSQFTSFLWFIITLQFYYKQYTNAWHLSGGNPVTQQIETIVPTNSDFFSQMINWMVRAEQLLPYLSMAYLLLMVFLSIRWLMGYRNTQLIRYNGLQKIPVDWRLFVKKTAAQLDIKKEIRIFLSENITTPLTIGFLKPVILIPVASINHLTTDQLEAILLHELAHIKRYDYLINILLSAVEISLFFNPFTQLLSKHICKERENSCDDWVLQFQYKASVYAEALLRIAYLQHSPAFAMAASGKKQNELLLRVKRMIEKKENHFSYRKQLLALVIITGIISSIAWLNPLHPYGNQSSPISVKNASQQVKRQSYAVEPMAITVDNPLFNPVFFLSKPLKEEMKKNIASAQKEIAETITSSASDGIGGLIESIPPLVAGALNQAAHEMTVQKIQDEKQTAELELAKTNLEKVFRADSLFSSPQIKSKMKEDINLSVRKMDADLKKAKQELERAMAMNAEVYFNKEKVQQDIKKAIESIEKINTGKLEKAILNAIKIPGFVFENKGKKKDKKENEFDVTPDTKEIIIAEPDTEKELSEPVNEPLSTGREEINIELPFDKNELTINSFTPVQLQILQKLRLKMLMLKELEKIKLIPVLIKNNGTEETKWIIRLQ